MTESPQFERPDYVQTFLDNLKPLEPFAVRFIKQNGEERIIEGTLDPQGKTRKHAVPVMTKELRENPDGTVTEVSCWKSFLVDRVLWIGKKG